MKVDTAVIREAGEYLESVATRLCTKGLFRVSSSDVVEEIVRGSMP